jgi:hypothetical protein
MLDTNPFREYKRLLKETRYGGSYAEVRTIMDPSSSAEDLHKALDWVHKVASGKIPTGGGDVEDIDDLTGVTTRSVGGSVDHHYLFRQIANHPNADSTHLEKIDPIYHPRKSED